MYYPLEMYRCIAEIDSICPSYFEVEVKNVHSISSRQTLYICLQNLKLGDHSSGATHS